MKPVPDWRCVAFFLMIAMGMMSLVGCAGAGAGAATSSATPAHSLAIHWQADAPATLEKEGDHLRLREVLPDGPRFVRARLDRAALDAIAADTIVLDVAVPGSEVAMTLEVFGYPNPTDHRRYYLRKLGVKGPEGSWQRVHLKLAMDDDTFPMEEPRDDVEVVLKAPLNAKGVTDANATLDVLLGQARFIGTGMTIEPAADAYTSQVDATGGLVVTHRLTLHNIGQAARDVRLALDRTHLSRFKQAHVSPSKLRLEPGASVPVTATFKLSAADREALPVLYAERAALHVTDAHDGTLLAQPLLGYAPADLYAVVPPADKPHPWFTPTLTPEQAQTFLATAQGKRLLSNAQERLDIDPTPPALLHGNPNHFFDPQTNSQMRFHGIGKVWSEGRKAYVDVSDMPERVRKAEAYAHHTYLVKSALILAQAGHVTGDKAMSRKAADILLAYAERYPHYPSLNPRSSAFHARVGWAMLQDAWWIESVIEAADLVLGAGVLTDAQAGLIRRDLMETAAVTLRTHRVESNQQSEVNAGYGGAALVARRFDLVAEALDSQGGIRTQWRNDFDEDGYSIERDQSYHYAALGPMTRLANQVASLGVEIYDDTFKKLFIAPLARSLDGRVPMQSWVYRSAASHWPEPLFLSIAHQLPPSIESIAHPLPPLAGEVTVDRIATLPSAGYTVLRQLDDTGEPALVGTVNWGSPVYRGGIVLLSPAFFIHGQALNAQMTRIAYGYKESGFSYTAAAGNSLMVDGQAGSLLSADFVSQVTGPGMTAGLWRRGDDRPGWRGVDWSRAVVLVDAAAVVVDLIDSDKPRTFDFLWMMPVTAMGKVQGLPAGVDAPDLLTQGHGYDMLRDPKQRGQVNQWSLTYPVGRQGKGTFQGLGDNPFWLSATSRTNWHPKDSPLQILRLADRKQGWLVSVWSGSADRQPQPSVTVERLTARTADGNEAPPHQALALRVTCDGRAWRVLVSADPTQAKRTYQVDGATLTGPLAIERIVTP